MEVKVVCLRVPPHWPSTDERVAVLSGRFTMGMGNWLDAAAGAALTAGGYAMMPRRTHHRATATSPFVIQIQAMGPFDVHYINPADDPMEAKR